MSGYNGPTEEQRKILEQMEDKARVDVLLKRRYKEKWHPKKPKRKRGLKKGEWKGGNHATQ